MTKKRVRKWLIGVFGVIVLSILSLQITFLFFGNEILKKSILLSFQQYTRQAFLPGRLPTMNFENVSLNLLSGDLTFSGLHLTGYPPGFNTLDTADFVSIKVPKVSLNSIELIGFYKHRRIQLESIELLSPEVNLIKYELESSQKNPQEAIRVSATQFHQFIIPYFESLTFGRLLIKAGSFSTHYRDEENVFSTQFMADDVFITLFDFEMDSASLLETDHIFFFNHFDIRLGSYQLLTPDSTYLFKSDTLGYNSQEKKVYFKNFTARALSSDPNISKFSVQVPNMSLTDVDWQKVLYDSLFISDQWIIYQPKLSFNSKSERDSTEIDFNFKYINVKSLAPLLSDNIRKIQVNDILLSQGKINWQQTGQDTVEVVNVQNVELALKGISLDSTIRRYDSLKYSFPADTILLRFNNAKYTFPDYQHFLTVTKATVSTNRQSAYSCDVMLDSVNIKPGYDSLNQLFQAPYQIPIGYDVFIPQLYFHGLSLEALHLFEAADLDSLRINQPSVKIANFSRETLGKQAAGTSYKTNNRDTVPVQDNVKTILNDWSRARLNLRPFIAPGDSSALLQWLHAEKLQLDSGSLQVYQADTVRSTLTPITSVDTLYVSLSRIRIDHLPYDTLWRSDRGRVAVRAQDVDLFLKHGEFRLPGKGGEGGAARLEAARLSTYGDEVYLKNLFYKTSSGYPSNSDFWLHSLYIPYAKLDKINLQELYLNQVAQAKSFNAVSPQITFNYRISDIVRPKNTFDFVNLYPQFSDYLNKIALDQINLNDTDLTIRKISDSKTDSLFFTKSLNLGLSGFYIDSLVRMSNFRPFYAKKLRMELNQYQWNFLGEKNSNVFEGVVGEDFMYDSQYRHIKASNFTLLTNPENNTYIQNVNLEVSKVLIDDIDPYLLIKEKKLNVGRLVITQPSFDLSKQVKKLSPKSEKSSELKFLQPDMNSMLNKHLKNITLRIVHVEKGRLKFLNRSDRDTVAHVQINSIDFIAKNIIVDGTKTRHQRNILYADAVDYSLVSGPLLFNQKEKHRLTIGKATLVSGRSEMSLDDVSLFPNKSVVKNSSTTDIRFDSELLTLKGLDLKSAYLYGVLDIEQLQAANPKLKVNLALRSNLRVNKQLYIHQLVSPYIKSINIDEFIYSKGTVAIRNKKSGESIFQSDKVSATVQGVAVNQKLLDQRLDSKDKLFFADNIELKIRDYSRPLKNNSYKMRASLVSMNTADQELEFSEVQFLPSDSRGDYMKNRTYRSPFADVSATQINFEGVDFHQLFKDRRLKSKKLLIDNPEAKIFVDKSLPVDPYKKRYLPQQALYKINQPVDIDQVAIRNGLIDYSQRIKGGASDGYLSFEKVNLTIDNVSNNSITDRSLPIKAHLNTYLQGQGKLDAFFSFSPDTSNMNFSIRGALGYMPLKEFNTILEPVAFMQIKDGYNNDMDFEFKGDKNTVRGKMEFRYNDLSIQIIDKEKGQAGIDEKLGSFLANAFVIKKDNPKSVFLRIGNINYKRDTSKSVFNYWWQGIFSGIQSSIGLKNNSAKTKEFTPSEEF